MRSKSRHQYTGSTSTWL